MTSRFKVQYVSRPKSPRGQKTKKVCPQTNNKRIATTHQKIMSEMTSGRPSDFHAPQSGDRTQRTTNVTSGLCTRAESPRLRRRKLGRRVFISRCKDSPREIMIDPT